MVAAKPFDHCKGCFCGDRPNFSSGTDKADLTAFNIESIGESASLT